MRFANDSYQVCRLGDHMGNSFTGMDLNERALVWHQTRLCGSCIVTIAGYYF